MSAHLALDPRRTNAGIGFDFESIGEIEDGATGVAHGLPVVARANWIRRKERKVDAIELFVANALDKSDLVSHGLKLAERFVIVEQFHIDGREIAVVQDFGHFFPLQCPCADNGDAIQIACAQVLMSGRGFGGCAHDGRDASR